MSIFSFFVIYIYIFFLNSSFLLHNSKNAKQNLRNIKINPQYLAYLQINYLETFWRLLIDEQHLGEYF
jgi:hypothetical protein